MDKRIEFLLEKKRKNEELERFIDLYEKLDAFIEAEPAVLDKIGTAIDPGESETDFCIHFYRTDIPDRRVRLKIKVDCSETARALRDYYERQIIGLTENERCADRPCEE
jgi:hypothetical protein